MILGLLIQIGAILAFMWANSLGLLYFARFLQGVAGASIWTIGLAFIADLFPEHELGRAMGSVFLGLNVGALIGPVVGGVLFEYLGYHAPFIFNCVAIAIDLLLRLIVAEPDHTIDRADRVGFGTVDTRIKQIDPVKSAADGLGTGVELTRIESDSGLPSPAIAPPKPERTIYRTKLNWNVVTKPNPTFWDLLMDPCVMLICWLTVVGGVAVGIPSRSLE